MISRRQQGDIRVRISSSFADELAVLQRSGSKFGLWALTILPMEVVWYTAMSMDGRIADAQDSLDFLSHIDMGVDAAGEFSEFMSSIDAVVVGSNTMRWLLGQGESLPVTDKPVWILTRDESLRARITKLVDDDTLVHFAEGNVEAVLNEVERTGHKRVWICGGGVIAGQVLAADRLDEVIVTIASTALGAGPTIFEAAELPLRRFTLEECRKYGNAARLRWVRER